MVTSGAGFRAVVLYHVTLPQPRPTSEKVLFQVRINADEDQKQNRSSPQIVEFSAGNCENWLHIIKWYHPQMVIPGAAAPTPLATPLDRITLIILAYVK